MTRCARLLNVQVAGEVLDVLDTASLPMLPVKPNRLVIAMMGFGLGLLLGAFVPGLRRPRTAVLQPA